MHEAPDQEMSDALKKMKMKISFLSVVVNCVTAGNVSGMFHCINTTSFSRGVKSGQ